METVVVRVCRSSGGFRLTIPKRLVKLKEWENVTYVSLQSQWGNRIIIERAVIDETTKKKDTGN